MATSEELMAIVGSPVTSDAVRLLIAADGLRTFIEPDFGGGVASRAFLSGEAVGYQLAHVGGRVTTAFLYAEPAEGFVAFPGPLPGGIPGGATQTTVRARFGTPERSGAAVGAWDRFAVGDLRIHFQYAKPDGHAVLVTIMTADTAR